MQLKIWDVSSNQFELVIEKKMQVGALFAASFYSDSTFLVAAGGSQGTVAIWDLLEDANVRRKYGKFASQQDLDVYDESKNPTSSVHHGIEKRKYIRPADLD